MITWVRSILFAVVFIGWSVFAMLLALPALALSARLSRICTNLWADGVLVLLRLIAGISYEVRGWEHIPDTPCLIASKHQSAWETFALVTLLPRAAFIMKQELMRIPLYGRYARRVGMIGVEREKGAAALREITAMSQSAMADGRHVVIFPEGTRRAVGAPPDYKTGIGLLYKRLDAPCVPVALNSGSHWLNKSMLKRPGTIVLSFLPAIPPGAGTKEFLAELEESIEAETERLLSDTGGAHEQIVTDTKGAGQPER